MNIQRLLEITVHATRYVIHRHVLQYNHFGSKVAIDKNVKVYHPRDIFIGDMVHLQENVWLNVVNPAVKKVISIGDGCDIGRNGFISALSSVVLEDHVLIAPNVFISDHSHRYDDLTKPVVAQEATKPEPVRIGSGSWLGINVVILPGTQLGKHCVVGANSVVKGKYPDFSLIAGSPAKRIRSIKN